MDKLRTVIFEEDSWTLRRVVVFGILLYCGGTVWYILWRDTDTALSRDVANSLILLSGSIAGSYLFGAIWDSNNRRRRRSDMQPGIVETSTKTVITADPPPVAPIREEGP